MAQICISYAHPSKSTVRKLHDLLAIRYDVWWDDDIHSGDYRGEIERQLLIAGCVIPVWCRVARSDKDVLDEATFADRHGKTLVPVRIEDIDLPLGFGGLHTVDLIGWSGDPTDQRVQTLLNNISRALQMAPRLLPRPEELVFGNSRLAIPEMFRSVSSHETALQPENASTRSLYTVWILFWYLPMTW